MRPATRSQVTASLLAVVALAAVACSTTSRAIPHPTPTTTSTTAEPPSTVQIDTTGVRSTSDLHVPFTADEGILTVTAGPPPDTVTAARAAAIVSSLRAPLGGFPVRVTQVPISGLVHLAAGYGIPAMSGAPAWIVPFDYGVLSYCQNYAPVTLPAWASRLKVAIVEGARTDQIVIYIGAGAAMCQPNVEPTVRTWAQLSPTR